MTNQEISFAIKENLKMAEFFIKRDSEGDLLKAAQCLAWNEELMSQAVDHCNHFDNI